MKSRWSRTILPGITVRSFFRSALFLLLIMIYLQAPPAWSQTPLSSTGEVPIEHCDGLPVIRVRAAGAEMRFLVDTAANSILDLKSFSGGEWKQVEVSSWQGVTGARAREIVLKELEVGGSTLRDLKLRAIDLSAIARACGGKINGILGFDLMEKLGITLNLKRQIAEIEVSTDGLRSHLSEMEGAMHGCNAAFAEGDAAALADCFDPEIVLYTHVGEFRGKKEVMDYLQQHYLQYAPRIRYEEKLKEARMFGDVLWYTYDYVLETPREHLAGHGMAMCRRSGPRWRILNMHNSLLEPKQVSLVRGSQQK